MTRQPLSIPGLLTFDWLVVVVLFLAWFAMPAHTPAATDA